MLTDVLKDGRLFLEDEIAEYLTIPDIRCFY